MQTQNMILRSGGARGADRAFEAGVTDESLKQIFYKEDVCDEALYIAKQHHPSWKDCSESARALHARNVYQILGRNLDSPTRLVLCWTPDGSTGEYTSRKTGGTGTAIRIAYARGIRVYNFASGTREQYKEVITECLAI